MKHSYLALFLSIILLTVACKNGAPVQEVEGFSVFGENFNHKGAIQYDALMQKMSEQDTVKTAVVGKVKSVCQVKGCWMNIVSDDQSKEPIFVKFKDYGFFMPLDLAGKEVIMYGNAYTEITSVDELRHYAEDEGKSKEEIAKITEPVEEIKFMASGVKLANEKN